jgi:site-specific DNA-adenine methylase
MWSYFGTKRSIAKFYPSPQYPKIIEPFAGAAGYSLLYPDRKVHLNDLYKVVADIWDYLIHVQKERVLELPELKVKDSLNNYPDLSEIEKNLLGFAVCQGVESPRENVSSFSAGSIGKLKKRIIQFLPKIRHWQVTNLNYQDIPNEEACWYIDPPYWEAGTAYVHDCKSINYDELAEWCRSRKGQVIVCENTTATWLPFKPLVKLSGMHHQTTEVIWYRDDSGNSLDQFLT